MGDYWHCNHLSYPEINYDIQSKRIKQDKAKKTYFKNCKGIDILYLWECDIINNKDKISQMILEYTNGILKDFNSFNYINETNDMPYMDWDVNDLNKITNYNVIRNKSRKDESKHEIIKCDYCGKEFEVLKSHHDKNSKSHCCSRKCSQLHMNLYGKTYVECNFCGEYILKKNSDIKRNKYKTFYCNKLCNHLDRKFKASERKFGGDIKYEQTN